MKDLKEIIAENIAKFRKSAGLTQAELAEKINYSDKAVSKWERADAVPDVIILKELADIFGVSVDTLLTENPSVKVKKKYNLLTRTNIVICSVLFVWFIAVLSFCMLQFFTPLNNFKAYNVFIIAIPVSAIVLLIYNAVWGKIIYYLFILSVLIWSLSLTVFMTVSFNNSYLVFIIGIPLQIIVLVFFIFKHKILKHKKENL